MRVIEAPKHDLLVYTSPDELRRTMQDFIDYYLMQVQRELKVSVGASTGVRDKDSADY